MSTCMAGRLGTGRHQRCKLQRHWQKSLWPSLLSHSTRKCILQKPNPQHARQTQGCPARSVSCSVERPPPQSTSPIQGCSNSAKSSNHWRSPAWSQRGHWGWWSISTLRNQKRHLAQSHEQSQVEWQYVGAGNHRKQSLQWKSHAQVLQYPSSKGTHWMHWARCGLLSLEGSHAPKRSSCEKHCLQSLSSLGWSKS